MELFALHLEDAAEALVVSMPGGGFGHGSRWVVNPGVAISFLRGWIGTFVRFAHRGRGERRPYEEDHYGRACCGAFVCRDQPTVRNRSTAPPKGDF